MTTAVSQALAAYRAAVDESRRADYAKQRAAQALYEARQAAGTEAEHVESDSGEPLPDTAFHATIAYVDEPTKDGRVIAPGAIDWQFGQRIPVTSGFEGGEVIGHAIPSHIDVRNGAVMATIYVEKMDRGEVGLSLGVGLDSTEVSVDEDHGRMSITAGRLRQIAAQPAEQASWPGVVVKP